jgi:hypothetical protein
MPEVAGGLPCKHITYVSSVPSIRETDTAAGGDREEHRPVDDALELVLAAKRSREGGSSGTPPVGS